ncbi:MAG: serine/threonine-protein kinase, partial [Planctomycetota bacterium]
MPADRAGLIGSLAVEKGLMSSEELREALEEFGRRKEAGSQVPLGELLVELGHISRVQLESLLKAQGGKKGPRQQIAGFELIKKLGEGGMGAVYLARQLSMDRLVALKVLRRKLARNREFVERFIREAQLAGRLDHVNIVHALNVGESDGFHYLAMEYVEGRTLSSLVAGGGRMDQEQALALVIQVARALDYAHRHGIIHRDVKPENVLVTAEGVAKLTDMGLAKHTGTESHVTQDGTMVGTPHYASPEQARGQADVDIRADIYSLGGTLYRLVTGETPYSGPTAAVVMSKHLTEPVPRAADVNPEVSESLCRVIEKMMAKEPADRYATPEELIADLELVAAGERPAAARAVRRRRRGGSTRSTLPVKAVGGRRLPAPVLAGIGAAVLLLAVITTWALTRGGDDGGTSPGAESRPPLALTGPHAPDPGPDEKSFEEMLAYAREYWEKNPEEYEETAAKFEQVRVTARGHVVAMKAADAIAEVKKARAAAAAAALADLKDRAGKLAGAGDFDAALKLLAAPPEKFANTLAAGVKQAADEVRGRAELKCKTAADAAAALSEAGEPEKALAGLEKLGGVKYAAWAARIAALRARLEKQKAEVAANAKKQRLAAAAKRLGEILDRFDELALAGKHPAAAAHLAAERARLGKDVLPHVEAKLAAAEKVAAELVAAGKARGEALAALKGREETLRRRDGGTLKGKITEVRGEVLRVEIRFKAGAGWATRTVDVPLSALAPEELTRLLPERKPAGDHGQVAAAISAMAGKRFSAAGKALAAAGEHPLAERYTRVMKKLRDGAVELAAEDAWIAEIKPLAAEQYSVPQARKLLAALDAYAAAHGKSKYAAEHRPEADRLRALAEKAIEDSPEGMTAQVNKLFRGKVLNFDPKTLAFEVLWDFSDARQLEDFELMAGDWTVEGGTLQGATGHPGPGRQARPRARFTGDCRVSCTVRMREGWRAHVLMGRPWDWAGLTLSYYGYGGRPKTQTWVRRDSFLKSRGQVRGRDLEELKLGRPIAVSAQLTGREWSATAAGKEVGKIADAAFDPVRVSLLITFDPYYLRKPLEACFDDLRVTGRLDRAWLQAALARAKEPPPKPAAFRAAWQKMKIVGEGPSPRSHMCDAMLYDPKRKRCVLYGGFRHPNNYTDIWS